MNNQKIESETAQAQKTTLALNNIINILFYLYEKEKRSTEKRNSLKPPDGAHYTLLCLIIIRY